MNCASFRLRPSRPWRRASKVWACVRPARARDSARMQRCVRCSVDALTCVIGVSLLHADAVSLPHSRCASPCRAECGGIGAHGAGAEFAAGITCPRTRTDDDGPTWRETARRVTARQAPVCHSLGRLQLPRPTPPVPDRGTPASTTNQSLGGASVAPNVASTPLHPSAPHSPLDHNPGRHNGVQAQGMQGMRGLEGKAEA